MPMSERDTHFAGFAKLLLKEMMSEYGYVDLVDWSEQEIADYETGIARRAYDLAVHVIDQVSEYMAAIMSSEDALLEISDMTEWPNEAERQLEKEKYKYL